MRSDCWYPFDDLRPLSDLREAPVVVVRRSDCFGSGGRGAPRVRIESLDPRSPKSKSSSLGSDSTLLRTIEGGVGGSGGGGRV